MKGEVCVISRNGEVICHILKSGKTSDGILEEKFWGTDEGIREVGANGSDVGTCKGGKMEHL